MMNEFPPKFMEVVRESTGSDSPMMNVSEYLENLFAMGIKESDLTTIQPLFQKRIWDRVPKGSGPEKVKKAIEDLKKEDGRFHVDGGSWTNDISWVKGYENVLDPMQKFSARFNEKILKAGVSPDDSRFRNALYHLLVSQTSCYRYWGQGLWTDYAQEICRRGMDILNHDL
ncbi:MAG: glycosyl hydrolase family 57, partial [Fibrobacter sp.]|nr:glycosyl hydrolase family 57 [Fibrobacter sp.]